MDILAAEAETIAFNGLVISFGISGAILLVIGIIGGKNSVGKRIFFGVLGLILLGVAGMYMFGVWHEITILRGRAGLCEVIGPWAAVVYGLVGMFRNVDGPKGDGTGLPAPNAQQWNQQNPNAPQWGQPQAPGAWGAPGQAAPQQWGAPGAQAAPQWGQVPGQAGPPAQPYAPEPGYQPQYPQQGQPGQYPAEPGYQPQYPQQPGQPGQYPPPQQGWQQYPPQA